MASTKVKRMAYRYWRKPTTKGYKRKGYSFKKAIGHYKKTGWFKTVSGGSGHTAGYRWAEAKGIDPESKVRRYSKNSPSFDEGVYKYKQDRKTDTKMADMVRRTKTLSYAQSASNPPKKKEVKV